MTTKQQITDFLAAEPIAVAGVSRNPKKFGYIAFKEVRDKGLNVIPLNPNTDEINGISCYNTIPSLPPDVKSIWILTNKEKTAGVVTEAMAQGFKNIWIQQSSDSPEALALLNGQEVNLITKECLLMHYKASGIHKFHRTLKGWFGRLPK